MTPALVLYLVTAPIPRRALPSSPEPIRLTRVAPVTTGRFFDTHAKIAATATVALLATDSALTCDNLAHGGHEDWLRTQKCGPAVAQLAANKLAFWGVSYLAHRTGHHKLERVFEWAGPAWSAAGIASSVKNGGI